LSSTQSSPSSNTVADIAATVHPLPLHRPPPPSLPFRFFLSHAKWRATLRRIPPRSRFFHPHARGFGKLRRRSSRGTKCDGRPAGEGTCRAALSLNSIFLLRAARTDTLEPPQQEAVKPSPTNGRIRYRTPSAADLLPADDVTADAAAATAVAARIHRYSGAGARQ
jgi:hypothetical protein